MDEIKNIISLLDKTFNKGAWHGPTVTEILDQISQETALKKLPDTHSIISLVAHMTTWRTYAIQKLKGIDMAMTDELNFPDTTDWLDAREKLISSQRDLIAAIEHFNPAQLHDLVPSASHPYTFFTLVHGVIHHDLYHVGQIILIKKASQQQTL